MVNEGSRIRDPNRRTDTSESVARVLDYHQRTKHRLHQYARALGYLDWATQPDPFRTYAGASRIDLPLMADRLTASFADLYHPGALTTEPLSVDCIAVLLELSLGLSAWKEYRDSRWALRCNPSSGNLHPTEGYVIVPQLPGLPAGVYHYDSRNHCLEHRCAFDPATMLPPGTFLVGLSSIYWREAWKYGERAFRYCQHDVGHAIAAVRYAAAALGWSAVLLDHLADDAVASLLGLDQAASFAEVQPADREHPDAVLLISTRPAEITLPDELPLTVLGNAHWAGRANPLSPGHVDWPVIDLVAAATLKPATSRQQPTENLTLPTPGLTSRVPAAHLIRQRRSCLGLDETTSIPAGDFYGMLDHLLPRPGVPPWDALPWEPHIHAGIFVHRVRDLAPGLYAFERSPTVHLRLQTATRGEFAWKRVATCPEHLRLFLLAEGDFRDAARVVSCHQEIASDGAFSLGMIADFGACSRGAWWYRRLFWEAGVLGQVLYLEAEAAGVRGTGIGCYFDDVFHDQLGLCGDQFQDLYHFTVGGPVDDPRLTTLPPYAHLQRS
jgi:SagB-type dehydrogenase family enzyme